MRERARRIRCAIYTRKSSEEGLEQEFNSLDAQREACEAFILSQKHEGWSVLPQVYDDGGFSGGTMDRPALKRLLADIASGQIDCVVVYKVDRLTRALSDFARMVEVFDRENVSFVSVTQQFNTTTSMGRLTLNVLLSFAQFEREVTGERIRDKISASKKKGMWMGGFVPIGYEAKDRTLIINEAEAETVRTIFRLYLELKSVDALKEELDRRGLRTKARPDRGERMQGGLPFGRGHLYRILSNPLYRGQISHKGQVYPGQHEAIIDGETWEEVQAALAQNSHRHLVKAHSKNPSLLAGLLLTAEGESLVSTHANKQGRRYRYYVSASGLKPRRRDRAEGNEGSAREGTPTCPGPLWRLPASEVEGVVIRILTGLLTDPHWLLDHVASEEMTLNERQAMLARAGELARQLEGMDAIARRAVVLAIVDAITVGEGEIAIRLRPHAIANGGSNEANGGSGESASVLVRRSAVLRRRGIETRLIIEGEEAGPEPDPALIKALAQAHRWWGDLVEQRYGTMRALARAYDTDERYVARILCLAFLSPDLTCAILDGTQPPELTLHALLKKQEIPLAWNEQKELGRGEARSS
jgi:site-specific DNA recombinase